MKITCSHCGVHLEIEDCSGVDCVECPSCHGIVNLTKPRQKCGRRILNTILLSVTVALLSAQVSLSLFGIIHKQHSGASEYSRIVCSELKGIRDELKNIRGNIGLLDSSGKSASLHHDENLLNIWQSVEHATKRLDAIANITKGTNFLIAKSINGSDSSGESKSNVEYEVGEILKILREINDRIDSVRSDLSSIDSSVDSIDFTMSIVK